MKLIELTEKHKEKLLEMCKVLFPEFLIDEDTYFNKDRMLSTNLKIKENKYVEYNIHWFEFTFSILNKILENEPSPIKITKTIKEYGFVCFNKSESNHPVDWLYNLYKKYEKVN